MLGTGSLLPPLAESEAAKKSAGPAEGEEGGEREPTAAEVRELLQKNLYHQNLVTEAEVETRLRLSTGKNHKAFLARNAAGAKNKGKPKDPNKKAMWQRLGEVKQPLLMLYGRDDRGQAGKRAEELKRQQPALDLHILPNCKHLLQWDAENGFPSPRRAVPARLSEALFRPTLFLTLPLQGRVKRQSEFPRGTPI